MSIISPSHHHTKPPPQGTNATIFRTQLAPLQNLLPPTYDLVFADAPIISSAAPGIAAVFPGPYRAWYHTPHNAAVAEAHDVVRGLLGEAEAEGRPFEGFAGFSQVSLFVLAFWGGGGVVGEIVGEREVVRIDIRGKKGSGVTERERG